MSGTPQTTPLSTAIEIITALLKRRRPLLVRIAWTAFRVLLIIYVAVGVVLFFAQPWLIFPGAFIHAKDNVVIPPAGCELVVMKTADGTGISSLFGPALDADGRAARIDAAACPTILYFYGNGDCIGSSLDIFRRLRQLGANVLIPEYPGYRMSSGNPSEAGFYATADAAFGWLKSRRRVDASSIFVMGRSIGAAPAIDLASRADVAGLITVSAFTSLDEMAPRVVPGYPTSIVLQSHFRNADKIARVRCPILLVHGDKDKFVPPSMMTRLAAKAPGNVTRVTLVGADHNNVFDLGGEALSDAIEKFLRRICPTLMQAERRSRASGVSGTSIALTPFKPLSPPYWRIRRD